MISLRPNHSGNKLKLRKNVPGSNREPAWCVKEKTKPFELSRRTLVHGVRSERGACVNRSCETEEQEVHFGLQPVRLAPMHLVANPLPERAHEYAAPQASWLQIDRPVQMSTDSENPAGFAPCGSNVSPADIKRAADFLWTLNCRFEKPHFSILQLRKPFPPRLSRYLQRLDSVQSDSSESCLSPGTNCKSP